MWTPIYSRNIAITTTLMGALVFGGVACDTGIDNVNDDESVTVSGRVTDSESSSAKAGQLEQKYPAGSVAEVEGAVVTAMAVNADGSVSTLDGETTTDANGEFSFTVEGEGAIDKIRIKANGDSEFESSAIVEVDGESSVESRPLTAKSHAEAEVYVEAKSEDNAESHEEGVTTADVSVFVNPDVAAEINSGSQSAADFGMAIANAVNAQAGYNNQVQAGVDMNAVAVAKKEAYAQLQTELSAAADAEGRAVAMAAFEEMYLNVFSEAGADLKTQAEFHQTGTSILVESSGDAEGNAEVGLRKQAELIRSQATALAIEAVFESKGASEATLEALADARTQLVADIKAATTVEAIIDAKSDYKAKVDAETESEFEISSEVRASAETEIESVIGTLKTTIAQLSIFVDGVAEVTAEAFADYYLDSRTNAKTSFESSGMAETEAEAAAEIIIMVGVMK